MLSKILCFSCILWVVLAPPAFSDNYYCSRKQHSFSTGAHDRLIDPCDLFYIS